MSASKLHLQAPCIMTPTPPSATMLMPSSFQGADNQGVQGSTCIRQAGGYRTLQVLVIVVPSVGMCAGGSPLLVPCPGAALPARPQCDPRRLRACLCPTS